MLNPICVTGREGVNKQTNGDNNSDGCGDGSVAGNFFWIDGFVSARHNWPNGDF